HAAHWIPARKHDLDLHHRGALARIDPDPGAWYSPEVTTAAQGMLSRIGVLGDIHCQEATLERALAFFHDELQVDAVLAVGDIVDGPGDADRTVALLREAKTLTVRGNHERWLLTGEQRPLPDATLE